MSNFLIPFFTFFPLSKKNLFLYSQFFSSLISISEITQKICECPSDKFTWNLMTWKTWNKIELNWSSLTNISCSLFHFFLRWLDVVKCNWTFLKWILRWEVKNMKRIKVRYYFRFSVSWGAFSWIFIYSYLFQKLSNLTDFSF